MSQAAASNGGRASSKPKKGFFARIVQFFQEVFRELKKVQRPSRSELWKLFLTVVFFVAVVMLFVALIDIVFAELVFFIFG